MGSTDQFKSLVKGFKFIFCLILISNLGKITADELLGIADEIRVSWKTCTITDILLNVGQ